MYEWTIRCAVNVVYADGGFTGFKLSVSL